MRTRPDRLREQVGKRPVRQRREPDADVVERRAERKRALLRARQARGRAHGRPGEHRARRVDDEQSLGAHPNVSHVPARDDGLSRGETDKDRDEDERGEHRQTRPPGRCAEAEARANPARPHDDRDRRQERDHSEQGNGAPKRR